MAKSSKNLLLQHHSELKKNLGGVANVNAKIERLSSQLNRTAIASTLLLATLLLSFVATPASAASPGFNNLTESDFNSAIREISANATYHSVTGAGTLGTIFGFEVGLVGGLTTTPTIDTLSKQVDSSADVSRLPHAALLLGASVPMGFTAEVLYFPEMSISEVKYRQFGGSVKWTATDVLMLPFNLAIRGFVTSHKMSFDQTISNSSTSGVATRMTVSEENSQYGLQLLASPNLPIFEPYAGVGFVKATGKLAVSGVATGTIFAPSFTSSQSAESSPTSTQLLAGINVNLLVLNVGLEYMRAFQTNSYNFKLGFRF